MFSIFPPLPGLIARIVCMLAAPAIVLGHVHMQAHAAQTGAPVKILHVMSYHMPWRWTEDQLKGFKDGLAIPNAEFKIYEMDTKRRSSDEWKAKAGTEARRLIDEWKPDLLYTNDDNAQEFVARHYVNADMPIVFSGVNAAPAAYGYDGSKNVTGVLETEHFVQSVRLLRGIAPNVRNIAIIYDEGPTWPGVIARMKAKLGDVPEVDIVSWTKIRTFAEYKEKIRELQGTVDAIGLLGIFTYLGEDGKNVPIETVLKWTAENSRLPDFAYWRDRVDHGTLAAVAVSGYQQGYAAGRKARQILVDGVSPDEIPIEATVKGQPFVSLARARALGIKVKSGILLTSEVITDYIWNRPR